MSRDKKGRVGTWRRSRRGRCRWTPWRRSRRPRRGPAGGGGRPRQASPASPAGSSSTLRAGEHPLALPAAAARPRPRGTPPTAGKQAASPCKVCEITEAGERGREGADPRMSVFGSVWSGRSECQCAHVKLGILGTTSVFISLLYVHVWHMTRGASGACSFRETSSVGYIKLNLKAGIKTHNYIIYT